MKRNVVLGVGRKVVDKKVMSGKTAEQQCVEIWKL